MRKTTLLCLLLAAVCACQKTPVPEPAPADADLSGTTVDLSTVQGLVARKIFVLNEGQMGSNNATLDFLRVSDANYIAGAFKKMNPDAAAGLGDVGNDIVVIGDELWMVVNNSGIVEVLSARDETEVAVIALPTPRSIAFDQQYAYVTSWAGASFSDTKNPKGQVYRIDLKTKQVEGSVEVGYQPEGIALSQGKLYVANSGGISSTLPPSYSYDNTVSIIDAASFQLRQTVEVQVNLAKVFADGSGNVYVTTAGNYWDVHSGLYMLDAAGHVSHISDYVSLAALSGDTLYCLGTEEEYEWTLPSKIWEAWRCTNGQKENIDLALEEQTPYGLCVLGQNALMIGDAGDYFNPGSVALYVDGNKKWSVTAGVCPGHFAIW